MITTSNCIGCGNCVNVCPQKNLKLEKNNKGFLEVCINTQNCALCNLCEQVCPNKSIVEMEKSYKCYAVYAKDENLVMSSSSGGIFSILARKTWLERGAVCGAVFIGMELLHICTEEVRELTLLQGSKYIQSDMQNCMQILKEKLDLGITVLFCGTPCQVAAVKLLYGEYVNLILVDLICHGTGSNRFFSDFISSLERRNRQKIKNFKFRSKNLLQTKYGFEYELTDGSKKNVDGGYSAFGKAYFGGYIMRDSCYNCQYSNCERVGDITLGDYWNCEKEHSDFYNSKGVSAVLVNTKKGEEIFNAVCDQFEMIETSLEAIRKNNNNLNNPTIKNKHTELFWYEYDCRGYDYIYNKYLRKTIKEKVKCFLYSLLGRRRNG